MGHHHAGSTPAVHEHADSWHHHGSEEGLPQREHASVAKAGSITKWYVGIVVSVGVTVLVLVMYYGLYSSTMKTELFEEQAWKAMAAEASSAKAQQMAELEKGAWPISAAMDKVVEKYAQKK